MRARFLADEHFDFRVCDRLRAMGHDVLTVRQANESKFGDGWPDPQVLSFAIEQNRIVLTENVSDFKYLHIAMPWHKGIIACSKFPAKPAKMAKHIERILGETLDEHVTATGQWMRLTRHT